QPRRNEIAGPVCLVALQRKTVYLAEKFRVHGGNRAQGFQVASPRRLQMDQPARLPRRNRVDAELIRPRMQAELIRSKLPRNRRVNGEICLERGQVAYVIDALLEPPDVTWREADPLHAQPLQFIHHVNVLGVAGW